MHLISGHDGGCSRMGTVSIVGTALVEGANGRVHPMPVSCGDDRPHAGRGVAWFSQAMGPTLAALYCAVGPEWITNVIQTGSSRWKPQHYQLMKKKPRPQSSYLLNKGDKSEPDQDVTFNSISAGGRAGALSRGVIGGCRKTPP